MKPLPDQQSFARAVLDSLPAQIAVIDPAGRITAVNAAWERFAVKNGGNPAAFGVGTDYLAACRRAADVSEQAAAAHAGIRSILENHLPEFSLEYPCHSPDGRHWYVMTVTPLRDARGPTDLDPPAGAVISHHEITARVLAERRAVKLHGNLRRRAASLLGIARKLKRSNEELDQFAYVTSHDLRAPLRGIETVSRWIEEDLGPAVTADAAAQFRLLRGRVSRMQSLIAALLEYSRVGRGDAATVAVDSGALAREVIDLLAPPATFAVTVEGPMPAVPAVPVQLEQVLMNLVGNAVKHTLADRPAGPGRVAVCCRDAGERWEFAVADDGPGIAPRFHERVFTIFQTLRPRDEVEGAGVGLALVKKIVERRGGAVWIDSAEGRGATFRFTWPKLKPNPK